MKLGFFYEYKNKLDPINKNEFSLHSNMLLVTFYRGGHFTITFVTKFEIQFEDYTNVNEMKAHLMFSKPYDRFIY